MEITLLCKKDKDEPRGERHRKTILHLINKEPKRIRMMSMNFHDTELDGSRTLSKMLKRMLVRGTIVNIIVGENPTKMDFETVDFLQDLMNFGAKIYHHPRIHAKLFLSEGRNNEVDIIITSANFTKGGFYNNFELGCYFSNMEVKYSKIIDNFFKYILSLPSKKSLEEWDTIFSS